MVETWRFQRRGPEFSPWSESEDPTCCLVWPKKKGKKGVSGNKAITTPSTASEVT